MNSAAAICPPAARVAANIRRAESGFHTPLLYRVPGLIAKDVTIGALMALEKSTTLRHRCAVRTPLYPAGGEGVASSDPEKNVELAQVPLTRRYAGDRADANFRNCGFARSIGGRFENKSN
jgi:hypothetical protein